MDDRVIGEALYLLAAFCAALAVREALRCWLTWARSDIIGGDGSTYMERWKLVRTRWFQIRVHHFLRSDSYEDTLHDHPTWFVSLMLWPGYREVRPAYDVRGPHAAFLHGLGVFKTVIRRPLSIAYRRARDLHRVELLRRPCAVCQERGFEYIPEMCFHGRKERPAWTLVLWGPAERAWGYVDRTGTWVPSYEMHARTGATLHEPYPRENRVDPKEDTPS